MLNSVKVWKFGGQVKVVRVLGIYNEPSETTYLCWRGPGVGAEEALGPWNLGFRKENREINRQSNYILSGVFPSATTIALE